MKSTHGKTSDKKTQHTLIKERQRNHDFHFAAISMDLAELTSITVVREWFSRLGGAEERSHSVQFDQVFKNAIRRKASSSDPVVHIGRNFTRL